MSKFTPYEIKIIDFVNKEFSGIYPTKQSVIKWIKNTLGYTNEEAQQVFALWFLNKDTKSYVDIGNDKFRIPWETIEYVNRGDTLYKFVERLKEKDGDEDEVLEVYYPSDEHNKLVKTLLGDDFHYCNPNGYIKTPCVHFDRDGLEIAGSSEDFEQFISGVGDQAWRIGDDGGSNEDYDNEEFNYVMYNDKTLDIVKKIGDIVGVHIDDSQYGGMDNDGGLYTYLTEFLTNDDRDDVVNEYVWALNSETGRFRAEQVNEYYEDAITYKPYNSQFSYGPYTIKIPYEDLLEKIKENGLFTFSDLQDLEEELNPCDNCDLDDAYWSSDYIDDAGASYVKGVLNAELERKLDKLENDENYAEKIILKKDFENLLKQSGFTYHNWMKKWTSGDGKLQFLDKDLDFDEKMITFTYNGEKHKTSLEDFTPWVQGSVLDLNECVTVSKFRLIMETVGDPLDINKIAIFDFDGTLMDTPHAEEGKREWEEKTGSPYPHRGWWSKRESLDTEVFNIQPIKSTIRDYVIENEVPTTYMVMLTGRLPNQKDQVEDILHTNDIVFDEYHYKDDGDTLKSKLNTIVSLLNRFPNTELIEMYEDREPHAIAFEEWGKENDVNIKVNLVTKPQLDFK
tara:strand:+ start:7406 stop:9271 length:1866 start_codon:yes stop_codon:yes gene_type:complete